MGTNYAPLIADLFIIIIIILLSQISWLSSDKYAGSIQAFNSNINNINNLYFEGMVNRIYPPELQLNKANASDTEPLFSVYIYLFQTDLFHPIYDKRDDFEFDKVFCFLFGW